MRSYRPKSWIDPRVEVRSSIIEGKGMFAREPIKKGDVVVIWGGTLMTEEDIKAGKARRHSIAAIDEGLYLAGLPNEGDSPDDFMNHSCDPNVWMKDEVTLVARRDTQAGGGVDGGLRDVGTRRRLGNASRVSLWFSALQKSHHGKRLEAEGTPKKIQEPLFAFHQQADK